MSQTSRVLWKPLLILLFSVFLSACAPTSSKPNSVLAQANRHMVSAQALAAKLAWSRAADQYEKAMLFYDGVHDVEGRTNAALGLGRALSELGESKRALALIEQCLQFQGQLPEPVMAQLWGRHASIMLGLGKPDAAAQSLSKAQSFCRAPCAQSSALTVLGARIDLASGNHVQAQLALKAALSDMVMSRAERANAMRALAHAQFESRDLASAMTTAHGALEIDKGLGLPARVALDLQLLSNLYAAQGSPELAQSHHDAAERARAAALALR